MSIFGTIMEKILPHQSATLPPTLAANSPMPMANTPSTNQSNTIDVEAILTGLAAKSGETYNWQSSIVDLMKLLKMDSSLTARKELAKELNYNGDTNDSATMNVWLHKQVMTKLAENGGTVPVALKH